MTRIPITTKWRLTRTFRKNQKFVEINLQVTSDARKSSLDAGLEDLALLYNVSLYSILWNYDQSCLLDEITKTKSQWKRKLYSRHLLMTILECTDDLTSLLGKPFRDSLTRLGFADKFDRELKALHGQLVRFNRTNSALLRRVRNSVAAHREHNAAMQIEIIESLDPIESLELGRQSMEWINRLYLFVNRIVEKHSDLLKKAIDETSPKSHRA